MGLFDLVGKAPKLEDVIVAVEEVDGRVINLEQYVARNEARITALERRYDQVIVVAGARINELEQGITRERRKGDQLRWMTRRRRRRGQS